MVKINVSKQSNYPISGVKVRKFLQEFFKKNGIVSDSECHVSFVSEAKMKEIGKKFYRKDNKVHNVFSFVESEVSTRGGPAFGWPNNNNTIFLGEIVVCFPIVLKEAEQEGKLIEEKVLELVGHSALHLLGKHHEE